MGAADLYGVLGVKRDATADEIRRGYRRAAKSAHPDGGGSPERFALIRVAVDTLGDDKRRAHYDATGEIEDRPVDNSEAIAMQVVINVIDRVLNGCAQQGRAPEQVDVVGSAIRNLENDLAKIPARLAEMRQGASMMKKLAKRFRSKGRKGPNRITPLFEQRAAQCERDERMLEQEKQQIGRALEILREHDFDFEKAEMRDMGMTLRSMQDLLGGFR